MAHADDVYGRLLEAIRSEFPKFRLIRKDQSFFQKLLHYGLVALTFGGMKHYLNGYQTTIGWTVYVTPDWDERDPRERYVTMRHELVHLRQFRRYTPLGMGLLYLLVPFPLGLAYFRARFEQEAYEETIRAAAEVYGIDYVCTPRFRERIVSQFLGASYGWMWPFSQNINAWYDRAVAKVQAELAQIALETRQERVSV